MFGKFETRRQPLLPRHRFAIRMLLFVLLALVVDVAAVAIGGLGFHYLDGMSWLEASENAAMIITGNGPVQQAQSTAGRIFQIFEALVGGILFVAVISVLLAPVFHRVLHAFSLEPEDVEES